VPGNHDVNRKNFDKEVCEFTNQDDINDFLGEQHTFSTLMEKFSEFNAFSKHVMGKHFFDDTAYYYVDSPRFEKEDQWFKLNLVGLNSALFAGYDGDDERKLALGNKQVEGAFSQLYEKPLLTISFFHHPFECFHPADESSLTRLKEKSDIILTGHLHKDTPYFREEGLAGKYISIGAGACYEKHSSHNSFNTVEIDVENNDLWVQFYKYSDRNNSWIKNKDITKNSDGRVHFELKINKNLMFWPVGPKDISKSFINNHEDAEYIPIKGMNFTPSNQDNEGKVSDLFFAKHPVTNKQYGRFIAYLEGDEPELKDILPVEQFRKLLIEYTEDCKNFKEYMGSDSASWTKKFRSTYDQDEKFNKEDHPVVGINWYDANAYCLWLSALEWAESENKEFLPAADLAAHYRLPCMVEWKYAAAGMTEVGSKRKYPWPTEKGELKPELANFEMNIKATTPVGKYENGATPEGLMDMAGNVWEWMLNAKRERPTQPVSCGGSWEDYSPTLSCSSAHTSWPADIKDANNIGFRVVRTVPDPVKECPSVILNKLVCTYDFYCTYSSTGVPQIPLKYTQPVSISTQTVPGKWNALKEHYETMKNVHIKELFKNQEDRFKRFYINDPKLPILLDFSKNIVTEKTMRLLFELATALNVKEHISDMFSGEKINWTKGRQVLHVALRNIDDHEQENKIFNQRVIGNINDISEKMQEFSDDVRDGQITGYSGRKFENIVNIGIGGSNLGPQMACEALRYYADGPNVHFVSNVDGTDILETLKYLDPATTLFLVASKSFTTEETKTNAQTAKEWLVKKSGVEAVKKHFAALSINRREAMKFGIHADNIFPIWEYVCPCFSLWSYLGLSICIRLGIDNFRELLRGAHDMDMHFFYKPLEENIPVILALLGFWYNNFFGAHSHGIFPYDRYLQGFVSYIQQLEMESNGKSIDRWGNRVDYQTGPIIFGDIGTNAQHTFFQLIHQGKKMVPADFIGFVKTLNPVGDHHLKLMANYFAQTKALAFGHYRDSVIKEKLQTANQGGKEINALAAHEVLEGNHPTNSILIDKLTPRTLGSLIAMYEHKTFVQGIIWRINSFDQYGVELGKKLARTIFPELKKKKVGDHDSSTSGLISHFLSFKPEDATTL
jgi:glucose-6-phosphate isomerase